MKNSKVLKGFLVLSGLLLTFIGGATLLMPIDMKATEGIDLTGNIAMLNDVRALSALIFVLALLILSGAFVKRLTFTSALVSPIMFLSLGVGRALSILLDGTPPDAMTKATILEFVLGTVGLILFMRFREKDLETSH